LIKHVVGKSGFNLQICEALLERGLRGVSIHRLLLRKGRVMKKANHEVVWMEV
jgi:hypothetical protein